MTDRLIAIHVFLEPIRQDDAQPLIEAIKQLRGVLDVTPVVQEIQYHSAKMSVKAELTRRLFQLITED